MRLPMESEHLVPDRQGVWDLYEVVGSCRKATDMPWARDLGVQSILTHQQSLRMDLQRYGQTRKRGYARGARGINDTLSLRFQQVELPIVKTRA